MSHTVSKEETMGIKSAFNRIIAARERQARRYVNGAMLTLDDAALKDAGFSREEIKRQGASYYPY